MNKKIGTRKNFKLKTITYRPQIDAYLSPKLSNPHISPISSQKQLNFDDSLRKPTLPLLSPRYSHNPQLNGSVTFRQTRFHSEPRKVGNFYCPYNVKVISYKEMVINQDGNKCLPIHSSIQIKNSQDQTIIVLSEGHGKFGQECASFVSQQLLSRLDRNLKQIQNIDSIKLLQSQQICELFKDINQEIKHQDQIDVTQSGATALTIIISQAQLICSNLGDSKSIFIYLDQNKLQQRQLNTQHQIEKITEQQRILKHGGKIEQESVNYKKQGPLKIWFKQDKGNSMMLPRCIGYSNWEQIGIICEPETIRFAIQCEGYIVIGNNQLFDIIDSIDIQRALSKHFPPFGQCEIDEASEQILQMAKNRIIDTNSIQQLIIILIYIGN